MRLTAFVAASDRSKSSPPRSTTTGTSWIVQGLSSTRSVHSVTSGMLPTGIEISQSERVPVPQTYTQKELDDAVSKAKSEVYREFCYKDYGTPDIRICPQCGKPDLHWSVSSSLNCRSCREDLRLGRAERRVRKLETFLEKLPMSTPETTELVGFDGFRGDEQKKPAYERVILRIDGGDGVGPLVDIFADGHVVFG